MKVKITLEGSETLDEAQELLVKALEAQTNGETHGDSFEDPVMQAAADQMITLNEKLTREMLEEIEELLEREIG